MVYITSHVSGCKKTWNFLTEEATYLSVLDFLNSKEGCRDEICLWNGRHLVIPSDEIFAKDTLLVATLRLRGGKGGFGSMLRAIGAQIEKTTNREACRDLSGRRLRDINEEKRLKDYLSKKVEKEKETLELKRKKLEQLKEGPKHFFEDKTYLEQKEKSANDIHESLDKAFSSKNEDCSVSGAKRKMVDAPKFNKKTRLLDDLDDSSSSDSDEDKAMKVIPVCSDVSENENQNSVAL